MKQKTIYKFWTCKKKHYDFEIISHKYCDIVSENENGSKHLITIDLTLMFGAGNEPQTKEEMEKLFPKNYYYYD